VVLGVFGIFARARAVAQGVGDPDSAVVPLLRERLDRMRTAAAAAAAAVGPHAQLAARAALLEPVGNPRRTACVRRTITWRS